MLNITFLMRYSYEELVDLGSVLLSGQERRILHQAARECSFNLDCTHCLWKGLSDELLRGGFTCADFTPKEHETLCDKMRGLGMKGRATALHQLIEPDLSPVEYEELVTTKGSDVMLEELCMK